MACRNKDYNPVPDFARVTGWVTVLPNWKEKITDWFKPEISDEIIRLIETNQFDENYGKRTLKDILANHDSLSNAVDVVSLKTAYTTLAGVRAESDYNNMVSGFVEKLISILLIDPKTWKTIDTLSIIPDLKIDKANKNIYDFKMELITKLWSILSPNKELNTSYQGEDAFTKLIADMLALYESKRLSDPELDKVDTWNTYFTLKYFDQLISSFSDFIQIKPEYASGRKKSNNMYNYIGPHVNYDTSFNPEEFTTAEQYASVYIQTLLDKFFHQVNAKGDILPETIGFKGFNAAITKLISWMESHSSEAIRQELYNETDMDWDWVIDKFLEDSSVATKDIVNILRGVKRLMGKSSPLDNKIKQILLMQAMRATSYEYEVFRPKWDPKLHSNVIVALRLREEMTDRQKGSVARAIRSRVRRSIKHPGTWERLKRSLNIELAPDKKSMILKGYAKQDIHLSFTEGNTNGEFLFTWTVEDEYGKLSKLDFNNTYNERFKSLIEVLLQIPITSNYNDYLGSSDFKAKTLLGAFSTSIALAIMGSEQIPDFSFRLDGNEMEIKESNYSDLGVTANFLSLINGIKERSTLTNGLGNDLPAVQQRSAIFNAKRMIDKASMPHLSEQVEHGIPEKYGIQWNNIYRNSILKHNSKTGSPIGRIVVRMDYNTDDKNRVSAEMNFAELNYFSVIKSFYQRLLTNGNIALQTTCLSDKHTHFLVEFLTGRISLRNGTNLTQALTRLTENFDNRGFNDKTLTALEEEIRFRRGEKTKVEVVNLLNRFEIMLGLKSEAYDYSTIDMPFETLLNRFKTINTYLYSTSIDNLYDAARRTGVKFFKESDVITLNGHTYLNETLYNNLLLYCDPDSTAFLNRMRREKMAYAKDMFKEGVKLDTLLDPSLRRFINKFKNHPNWKDWYNESSGIIQSFIIKDKNGQIVPLTYTKQDIEKYFNSDEYIVTLNPIFDSYFYANALLSNSFNDIVFGEDYGLANKFVKKAGDILKQLSEQRDELLKEIKVVETQVDTTFGNAQKEAQAKLNELNDELNRINADIKDNDYYGKKFAQFSEASRLSGHYKRTVHGGATYTPLVQNMRYGVSKKVKVAVIDDVGSPVFSVTGDSDTFTGQDGAGWASPYWSRMCNVSYVDGAVGKNKKTIFSYVDPETGILVLIKWAEYEITNSLRRDSPEDKFHNSYEIAFRKMHSFVINPNVFSDFDITDYYDLDELSTKPLYVYDLQTDTHYAIKNLRNEGNHFMWDLVSVNEYGQETNLSQTVPMERYVNSIYDLDQIFGGAWVEEKKDDGRLDFTEIQNDLVHRIICDLNLKDKFIGWAVNASAVKSGMSNNNHSDVFVSESDHDYDLRYFEMSTSNGGAQMNADHVIGETEVTEMSQMISALIQNGLKVKRVNEIYKFIGQVAADSLGDIETWIDDKDKLEDVYRWIGEALAFSFSQETDTLGLATAFISKATKNMEKAGLLTRIPFSAQTVKGKLEATITSFINSSAIKRRYPGGGFVQNPTFEARLMYNLGGIPMNYVDFVKAFRKENGMKSPEQRVTVDFALNNSDWDVNTRSFKNPYIQELPSRDRSLLDIGDTIIAYKQDEFGNLIEKEVVVLDTFEKWDRWRNLELAYEIAHWTIRPKNLLGSRTFFDVTDDWGTTRHTLYDLDSVRITMYAKMKPKKLTARHIAFIKAYLSKHPDFYTDYARKYFDASINDFNVNNENHMQALFNYARWDTKQTLKRLSKIQSAKSGLFEAHSSFRAITQSGNVTISNFNFRPSQVLMGLGAKKQFGILNRSDLQKVNADPELFFYNKMSYLTQHPSTASVPKDMYDATLHGADGSVGLLIVDSVRNKLPDGLMPAIEYRRDDNNHIWYNGEDLGYANGIQFYKYVGKDGQEYLVIKASDFNTFDAFNKTNKMFTSFLPNANDNNWELLAKHTPGIYQKDKMYFVEGLPEGRNRVFNPASLNDRIKKQKEEELRKLAKKKALFWEAFKKGIGTRIPAQSMQSFTAGEVVGFTDDDDTSIYVSTVLTWLMGSDFDIDKLYWMMYGFTEDGTLATFTDLDDFLNPEDCLALPKPANRKINVVFYRTEDELAEKELALHVTNQRYKQIDPKNDGFETLKACLDNDVKDGDTVLVSASDMDFKYWEPYTFNGSVPDLQSMLDTHEKSKRSKKIKSLALRNVVVKGILDVLRDCSTQYNLQIPISMDEQRDAAELSEAGAEEMYLTSDNPGSTFKMTVSNMTGRSVIGIGASSLKAFFAATTYFNTITSGLQELVENGQWTDNNAVWKLLRSLVFNSKFGKRGLITFANINFDDILSLLNVQGNEGLEEIVVSSLDLVDANNNLEAKDENGNFVYDFISQDYRGYIINVKKMLQYLDKAANGDWTSPIDAAFSLSGLISAATDNAKELILSKINATTKFADIYTYLLSTGESFKNIASFMVSDVFNVVAKYAESYILDPETAWFDLEHSIKFVLDEQTLPLVDNKIFESIITSKDETGVIMSVFSLFGTPQFNSKWHDSFNEKVANIWTNRNIAQVKAEVINIINNKYKDDETRDYTESYKGLLSWVYEILNDRPDLLLRYISGKIKSEIRKEGNRGQQQDLEPVPEPTPDDMEDAHEEERMSRSYNWNGKLSANEWKRYYQYVVTYLIPKNQAISGLDTSNLKVLQNKILPALEEQRMLAHILGINKGLKTNDFEEYKWIRDIESFVNERYINSGKPHKEFNMMQFIEDEAYRNQQIEDYESVKSTYNILDVVYRTKHFWAMLKMARTNRVLLEKAVALKYTRGVANKIMLANKSIVNGLSRGLTQKFNEKEYAILQRTIRDLITMNWIYSLGGLKLRVPVRRTANIYFKNGKDNVLKDNEAVAWNGEYPVDRFGNIIDDQINSYELDINDTDGMATLKWMMENYIVDALKNHPDFKDEPFIQELQNDYRKDEVSNEVIDYLTLPISLSNPTHNSELEQRIDRYRASFNRIYKKKVPKEIGIGDWTIGDLFYLYNLYVHKDGLGGNTFTRLFEYMVIQDDSSFLVNNYYDYIAKLDSGIEHIAELDELLEIPTGDYAAISSNPLLKEIRKQFAGTTSGASKFRVRISDDNQYEFLAANYEVLGIREPISKLDKNYYLYNFTRYNPIKLTENPSLERKLNNNPKARKVNAKEAVEVVVQYLQKMFKNVIPITTVNNDWVDKHIGKDRPQGDVLGFIKNGTIYINVDNAKVSTPIHEMMHIVFAVLKYGNNEQRKTYYDLMQNMTNAARNGNEFWQRYYQQISSNYEGYAVGSDLKEEILIKAMEDVFTNAYYDGLSPNKALSDDSAIKTTFDAFEQRIIQAINTAFSTILPLDVQAKDVLGYSLGELLTDFSSTLINLNNEDITKTYLPNIQRIANFKRKLVNAEKLTIEGDC